MALPATEKTICPECGKHVGKHQLEVHLAQHDMELDILDLVVRSEQERMEARTL